MSDAKDPALEARDDLFQAARDFVALAEYERNCDAELCVAACEFARVAHGYVGPFEAERIAELEGALRELIADVDEYGGPRGAFSSLDAARAALEGKR